MNKGRLLWMLVLIDVLLAFSSIGAEMFFGWTLPPSLAEYARQPVSRFPGPGAAFQLFLLGTSVACTFVAWIGLVNYWRFARRLYLAAWAYWLLLKLFSGPAVMTAPAAMVAELSGLVGGAILGLVYFSDLAHRFEPGPTERTAPGGANLSANRT